MSRANLTLALFSAGWLDLLPFRLLEAILTHNWVFLALLLLGMAVAAGGIALMLRTRRHR